MLSPRNATTARSPRSAIARRSAASTGSPRRTGSPASPVMKSVVSISSGAATTLGGGSDRGAAQAATMNAAMIRPNEERGPRKQLLRLWRAGTSRPLPRSSFLVRYPRLTSIAVARQRSTSPGTFITDEKRSVAGNRDPLGLPVAAFGQRRTGDDASVRRQLDHCPFARGDDEPVPGRRVPLDTGRMERRDTRTARDEIGSDAESSAIHERAAGYRPCEDRDHALQCPHARLLAREKQRIGRRIRRQSFDLAKRADSGVIRAKGDVSAVRALCTLMQDSVARHDPKTTAGNGESLEVTASAVSPERERLLHDLTRDVQLHDQRALVTVREQTT